MESNNQPQKALFLLFHGFEEFNGISKKIRYQVKGLQECGLDVRTCYYEISSTKHCQWKIDNTILADFGTGIFAKIKKRLNFRFIVDYVKAENIDIVYLRSYHNANPFTIRLVKQLKLVGAKVVMEIPTYPYDQEYITPRMKLDLFIDKCFRHRLATYLDGIVTFSHAGYIFGTPTIRISNGIDFDAVPLKKKHSDTTRELHLIGVAEVHYWHGFDRLVRGLADYYRTQPLYKVYFHIVGELTGPREREEILPVIRDNRLEPYVILHNARHGKELDVLFDQADFGIGSLGRHRSGITYIKTLKNREYAARGLAFAYSETDEDFDTRPYVLKVPADESPINISTIIDFYQALTISPAQIRESIQDLSWTLQMSKVVNHIFP